jgi:hypothetical protein
MKIKRSKLFFTSLLIIVILLLASYSIIQSNFDQFEKALAFKGPTAIVPPLATRSPNCAPYPSAKEEAKIRTATPSRGEKSNAASVVTVTPIPISNTIDLSPKTQSSDKLVITIFRCNGSFDQYIVGTDIKIPEDLHLGVGDTVYSSLPLGTHSVPPPLPNTTFTNSPIATNKPLFTATPSNSATNVPYPAPILTKTSILDKDKIPTSPYPAP